MKNISLPKKLSLCAITAFATVLLFPAVAWAAPMSITQTAETGTNPASTITVSDAAGAVVKSITYPGGTATIEPVDVTAGQEYYVTATAPGYVFKKQGGTVSESGANVSLVAVKAANLVVTIKVPTVTDYNGITVKLYSGTDTTVEPKATAVTNATGIITFESVPHGNYTLVLELPAGLANSGIPTNQAVTIPADPTGDVQVSVPAATAVGQGTLAITAVDSKGVPVKGAVFSVYKGTAASGDPVGSGTTDATGKANIASLAAGDYTVRVTTVPEGYTAPASQTASITDAAKNATLSFTFQTATVAPTTTAVDDLSQTADNTLKLVGGIFAAAGLVGIALLAGRSRRKNR